MIRLLRDALVVALFDLRSSLRSRKALLLLVLYLAGSMAATGVFVSILQQVERQAATALHVAATEHPGILTSRVMESPEVHSMIQGLVGDAELADELLQTPPLALFYGWIALSFVPILVTLTSSDAIAGEVDSGAARFALTRTSRGSWASGKLLGQTALMVAGLALGGAGSWVVGWASFTGFQGAATALWMLRLGSRACVSGFAYLGLVMGISLLTRSANRARAFALLALVAVGVLRALGNAPPVHDFAPSLVDGLLQLLPGSHVLDLWRPDPGRRLPAMLILLALGGSFFTGGYLRFVRRDG